MNRKKDQKAEERRQKAPDSLGNPDEYPAEEFAGFPGFGEAPEWGVGKPPMQPDHERQSEKRDRR